jgi:hypothetical protein
MDGEEEQSQWRNFRESLLATAGFVDGYRGMDGRLLSASSPQQSMLGNLNSAGAKAYMQNSPQVP